MSVYAVRGILCGKSICKYLSWLSLCYCCSLAFHLTIVDDEDDDDDDVSVDFIFLPKTRLHWGIVHIVCIYLLVVFYL